LCKRTRVRKVVEDPFGGQYEGDEATCHARYMGSDAACGDQWGMEDEAMNMHVDSKKDSHENDHDMSIQPPDSSSDDYSDYCASDDDELLKQTPVLSASAKRATKRRTGLDEFDRHYLGKMMLPQGTS
ncbi:hypothetical protein MKW98_024434, partial [Papaver atlanticum]